MSDPVDLRKTPARMRDEAEEWYYDLGLLAKVVEDNEKQSKIAREEAIVAQGKADDAHKRLLVVAGFVLFAFLLLAWRNEVAADQISASNARITMTQEITCLSGLEILVKFNAQQNTLIEIERANPFINEQVRAARIKAYGDARINPLPVCSESVPPE